MIFDPAFSLSLKSYKLFAKHHVQGRSAWSCFRRGEWCELVEFSPVAVAGCSFVPVDARRLKVLLTNIER